MKIKIVIFFLFAAILCNFLPAVDSFPQESATTERESPSTLQLNQKTSFDRFDYIIRWGVPSLFVALIIWLIQTVFKQYNKIRELRDSYRQAMKHQRSDEYNDLETRFTKVSTEFQALAKAFSASEKTIFEKFKQFDFYYSREKLYRELELPFIHWQGVENCIVFADREKKILKNLTYFDSEELKPWLSACDLLLLSMYWEICEGNYKKGLQQIQDILSLKELSSEIEASCLLQQARIHLENEKNDIHKIFKLLEKAKKLSPNNISILYLDAKLHNDSGEHKIAATILEKIRIIPNANLFPINIDLTLADVYTNMKNFKKALNLVEGYLMHHPYHVKSIKSKASILCADKTIDKNIVEQFCAQINTLNIGDDPELHYAIALLEYRLKRYEQAEERLNYIIERRPTFIDYRSLLANIYFDLNKEDELVRTLEMIKKLVNNTKMKERIKKIEENIEKLGIQKAKKVGRFNILIKYE